jgi:hypothetical protein
MTKVPKHDGEKIASLTNVAGNTEHLQAGN